MERWKGWIWFYFKISFFMPTKAILVKCRRLILSPSVCLSLTMLMAEKRHGLVSLYKDMEDCEGYEDIQVMWEIIHSSCPPNGNDNRSSKRPGHWRFCFRPT
ncbi:hypothetical protein RHMOL_Rhmol05G0310800 [Rhododendron molle]|uniref:Uncharacterized protein n=1 Tax=Rhododendron molle TaxID=49168 RepID=A0ACC0NX95_RHOML|nr:hypothetical protein RHMOL_Rhmol05G0310800 [Rhododendron molle]